MKAIFLSVFIIFFFQCGLLPQDSQQQLPPGMQEREIGSLRLRVPKDIKTYKYGGLTVTEGVNEYVARKMYEIGQQLDDLSRQCDALAQRLERLEEVIAVSPSAGSPAGEPAKQSAVSEQE